MNVADTSRLKMQNGMKSEPIGELLPWTLSPYICARKYHAQISKSRRIPLFCAAPFFCSSDRFLSGTATPGRALCSSGRPTTYVGRPESFPFLGVPCTDRGGLRCGAQSTLRRARQTVVSPSGHGPRDTPALRVLRWGARNPSRFSLPPPQPAACRAAPTQVAQPLCRRVAWHSHSWLCSLSSALLREWSSGKSGMTNELFLTLMLSLQRSYG